MLLSLFSEILQEDIVPRYPRAAPVVKTERKDNFVAYFLHSSAQINVFLSHVRFAPTIHHGRVLYTVTRVWVRAPHRRTPLTFHSAGARFVRRCLSQTLNLAVSDDHFADCFSFRFGPTCAHCMYVRFFFFQNIGTCVVNISGHV